MAEQTKMIINLDPHLHWEMVKVEIRELTQKFCKNMATKKHSEKEKIKSELDILENKLSLDPLNEKMLSEQLLKKKKFENMIEEETRGIRIRCGIRWIEEGERNTKFFLSLEKRRNTLNTIKQLKGDNDRVGWGDSILFFQIISFQPACASMHPKKIFEKYSRP